MNMISIIIPSFNEEKYLGKLLDSIKSSKFKDFEIIVSDNNSKDNTKKIAKKYGCVVTKGGKPGVGRNNGAKLAKHDLLFIDSDVIIKDPLLLENFLKRARKYDLATCKILPLSNNFFHRGYYIVKNYTNKYLWIKRKHVSGQFLFIKKNLFKKLKGYDETLYLAEEHDLATRAYLENAKIGFFMDLKVYNSVRRINKEGFLIQTFKTLYSELYRFLFGKIKKKIIKYEFGRY